MNILIVGSGGREHALAWKFSQSLQAGKISVTPGNDGIRACGFLKNGFEVNAEGLFSEENLQKLADEKTLVVIGSEVYLEKGLANQLRNANIHVVGPNQKAAQLESSKVFAKKIMKKNGVPTSDFQIFKEQADALSFLETSMWSEGCVVKMDSLAAGKGVVVCDTLNEAKEAVRFFFDGGAGFQKGSTLLIEKKVFGKEVSAFALCDGENFQILGYATDFKRLYDHQKGPNTGGMGAVTPVLWLTEDHKQRINEDVFQKTLSGMKAQGEVFQGILFAGLMIDKEEISVLEFNVRMGDPETQALVMANSEDWAELFLRSANGKLFPKNEDKNIPTNFVLHKVLASEGYPGTEPGQQIRLGVSLDLNLDNIIEIEKQMNGKVFFAGIKSKDSKWQTSGGRVLGFSLSGSDRQSLTEKSILFTEKLKFQGAQYRNDIGWTVDEK